MTVDRDGQDPAIKVVDVLADEVDTSGRGGDHRGRHAEVLFEFPATIHRASLGKGCDRRKDFVPAKGVPGSQGSSDSI